ncbi:major facilitator superfamily domain-containing protein [Macrophomina phaseolina]|uniref:Major facilitator superfamily domain-containing protein n=1 Tax=Macrophomina phaseolina TaxID=35725 RepID=A0ABQ8GQW8_9PEZI|nr:major facilitator superfamily domain-containing protein [Macrophomina phaseolina]
MSQTPEQRRDDIPGTEYLVDVGHSLSVSHAGAGRSDIVLIPQPTICGGDTLAWPQWKKHYQLFLLALYACAFSYGENTLGAAWTTVSEDTGVSLSNMNGGSALNYLLLGLVNILWIPTAMKLGRRPVLLLTTLICTSSAIWQGRFTGTAQWMLANVLNGVGTSAYQAVIQLCVFDMFFVHERGRGLAYYLFGQQLGSILGLITGGSIADGIGWRWSQYIVAIIDAGVFALLLLSFEETMFPRYLFQSRRPSADAVVAEPVEGSAQELGRSSVDRKGPQKSAAADDAEAGESFPDIPKRTAVQRLKLWTYYPQDATTWYQYFRRPFFLFAFPNVVIPGFIFAFGCTAGIVSFNTISEILTGPPYNWTTTSTGLVFLAALIGSVVGWATGGPVSDLLVVALARRNAGVKEPEMRLWALCPSALYAGGGYFLYGWGAQAGAHWLTIAVGVGAMIAQQVSACAVATTYAMDCFPGISGELVVVLAVCSSCVNFAISYSVQPFIEAAGYGWTFTFFGICVLASMGTAVPTAVYGKSWRRKCAGRYRGFLRERGEVE